MGGIVAPLLCGIGLAAAQQQGQDQVIEEGQGLGDRPIAGVPCVFFQGDIPPIMQAILLTPMLAHDPQQPRGPASAALRLVTP